MIYRVIIYRSSIIGRPLTIDLSTRCSLFSRVRCLSALVSSSAYQTALFSSIFQYIIAS